uniref:Uncharacterized protein n=1 Tax=viral metagenome TaxID=1070528 RepID=A0A6C0CRL0_9ZZZZ
MATSHSTPITNIPVMANIQVSEETHEDDPEIQAILNEVQVPTIQAPVHRPMIQNIPSVSPMMYMNGPPPMIETKSSWIQMEYGKRALVAAVVAAFLFYPRTFQMIYEKIPILAKFSSYDILIRTALLAMVLYLFMLKVQI